MFEGFDELLRLDMLTQLETIGDMVSAGITVVVSVAVVSGIIHLVASIARAVMQIGRD